MIRATDYIELRVEQEYYDSRSEPADYSIDKCKELLLSEAYNLKEDFVRFHHNPMKNCIMASMYLLKNPDTSIILPDNRAKVDGVSFTHDEVKEALYKAFPEKFI